MTIKDLAEEGVKLYSKTSPGIPADYVSIALVWKMFLGMAQEQERFQEEVRRQLADIESRFDDRKQ